MRVIQKLDDWLACFFMAAIVIITILAVAMRYIINRPLPWVEELTVALLIWAIMIGAASAMKARMHISIDAFTSLFSPHIQRRIHIFNDLLAAAVLIVFGVLGAELTLNAGNKIMPLLGLHYTYIDLAVPVGAFWMALYLLLNIKTPHTQACGQDETTEPVEAGR